jgi:Flp pilus assembly protein CpaB
MRKRILLALAALLVFGLAAVTFAFNHTQNHHSSATHCPMMKQNTPETKGVDMTNVTVAGDDENCCQPGADCCKGGSCCHKKS